LNRLLLIFTGVAAVGIVIIAAIVTFQFTQEQDERNRMIQEQQEIQARQELIDNMSLDEKALCGLQASQRENEIALYGKAETPYSSYQCEIYASTIGK
jgi:hypothetical protein